MDTHIKKVRSIFLMAQSKVFYAFSCMMDFHVFPLRAVKRMNCFVTFCVMFRFAFHFINWPFALPVVQLFSWVLSQTEKFDLDNTLHLPHCQYVGLVKKNEYMTSARGKCVQKWWLSFLLGDFKMRKISGVNKWLKRGLVFAILLPSVVSP